MTHYCCGGHPDVPHVPADEREDYVLRSRRDRVPFAAIATELGVSSERVFKIWARGMCRLASPKRIAEAALDARLRKLRGEHLALMAEAKAAGLDLSGVE